MFIIAIVIFWLGMHLAFDGTGNNILELPAMQLHSMAHIAIGHWPQHWRWWRAHLKLQTGLYTTPSLNSKTSVGACARHQL